MIHIQPSKIIEVFSGLIVCQLANGMSPVADYASAAPATPGIIHFYEPKPHDRPWQDTHDPLVVGGEAIFWWADLEPHEGVFNWSRVDKEIARWQSKGKRLDLRLGTAHNAPNISPAWLFDRYHIRRIGRGQWCDFEDNYGDYEPGPEMAAGFDGDGMRLANVEAEDLEEAGVGRL